MTFEIERLLDDTRRECINNECVRCRIYRKARCAAINKNGNARSETVRNLSEEAKRCHGFFKKRLTRAGLAKVVI
jgi:hypothetical protein